MSQIARKEFLHLSKENKEAEEKIKIANDAVTKLEYKKSIEIENQKKKIVQQNLKRHYVEDIIWEIKTNLRVGIES